MTSDRAHVFVMSRSFQPFDDKENQGPGGEGSAPWTGVQPFPAQTDAADLKSSRKAWRKTPGQSRRPVLRDITPLFKQTAVSHTEATPDEHSAPPNRPHTASASSCLSARPTTIIMTWLITALAAAF